MNALEVKGLYKTLGKFELQDISFELPYGYIMGYVGQNGAGKTTTIQLILERYKHTQGEIRVDGMLYDDDPIKYKEVIGYVSDETYFPTTFTVEDIEKTCRDFYPTFDREKFRRYVNEWDLPYKKKHDDFSKGMKIRLMFAAALARETKILILDEATSGLDPVVRSEILDLLQEYISDGQHSVLFSSHIMSDLEQIADYLFFLDKGKMIFKGYKDDLMDSYLLIKGGLNELSLEQEESFISVKKTSLGFEGLMSAEQASTIRSGWIVEKPTMEQIVVMMIQGIRRRK